MTIYEVDGQKSLCALCVTTHIGLGLPHQGHKEDCLCAKILEKYDSQPKDANVIFGDFSIAAVGSK